jgi:hypothetical protein
MGYNINGSLLTSSMLTPDGNISSKRFRKVTSDMISVVNTTGLGSVTASGNDVNGFYSVSYSHPSDGCASTGFAAILNSSLSWSYLVCLFSLTGTSACWNFNCDGYSPASGMLSYSAASGDVIFDYLNCFENTAFTKKSSACDNNSDNFMHPSFATASTRSFWMFSRRNGTTAAGPTHGRACGQGGNTTISNIYIY